MKSTKQSKAKKSAVSQARRTFCMFCGQSIADHKNADECAILGAVSNSLIETLGVVAGLTIIDRTEFLDTLRKQLKLKRR